MELQIVETPLIPVSEWTFNLYEVTYYSGTATKVLHIVSTDCHVDGDAEDCCPSSYYDEYSWELVRKVARPRQIGTLHGRRIDEHPRTAGEREARGGE